ncbi:MAG: DUF4230 domain-containing protein [Candidatus Paceibacterota bacterium]|jgi:hypothetical protein
MDKIFIKNKIITFSLVFILGMFAGFALGVGFGQGQNNKKEVITAQTVFDRVSSRGFLVTKSAYLDQNIDIEIDNGSDWSNFWWGHKITAEALVRVDLGVDLAQVKKEDISIDPAAKTICIKLPDPAVNSIVIEGDINTRISSGILKKLFASDSNEDYNLATAQLREKTRTAVEGNAELLSETKISAYDLLSFLFSDTGYLLKCSE